MGNALIIDLNFMGDMLMSSPAVKCLAQNGYEVDVIAHDFCFPMLRANPHIRTIYAGNAWLNALCARGKYDLVLQLNTSFKVNLMLWLTGCKKRLGYSYKWKGFSLTIKVPLDRRTATKGYRVRECLALLEKGLGITCKDERMIYDCS